MTDNHKITVLSVAITMLLLAVVNVAIWLTQTINSWGVTK